LPDNIQEVAKEKFELFKENPTYPYHPSLRIKKMKGWSKIWEGHVTEGYVFTFHKDIDPETEETIFVFRKIGTHDIYRNP
jgi:hypothetical protein